ncbi:malonyl CoA-acyl carrier protein transacylase [Gemmatimonadetes bacterium T265]|nr:malonyl CoA-acyl carrier protein transacylase [Gemmatimonadetes bacterium T265]
MGEPSPVVLLFPGQGSQIPSMAADLANAYPAAREVLDAVDAALAVPLSRLMAHGPADELTRTDNAQPALLAHGAALWVVLRDALAGRVVAAAGHSLGEFTAYHAAGAFPLPAAVRLVRRRGELMFASGTERPGAMAALLGDPSHPIEAICAEATAEAGTVVPANYNCPGQLVISGEVGGVERAMALAKAAGVKRAVRLPVSGAFHSPLMQDAQHGLDAALAGVSFADPSFPVYANVTAQPVTTADVARALLSQQLTSPVRWTETVAALATTYPDATYLELGPGTVLAGLVRKTAPGVRAVSCGTAAQVDALLTDLTS